MSNFRIILLVVVVALIAGVAGYLTRVSTVATDRGTAAVATPATKPLWYWAFDDLEGKQRPLSEWQGKFLVINFWATWCPPCLKEIPSFIALQKTYGENGLQFLGIALDRPEAVSEFAAEKGMNYPVLLGGDDVTAFMEELGNTIGALPFTAVIDRNGRIVKTQQGEWHHDDAEQFLQSRLN